MTIPHPIITQRLTQLGITTPEAVRAFLDPQAYTPASPFELPDMAQAVERVQRALNQGQQLLVWGDFDVDGQTSTALLVSALREVGGKVSYHIPNRFSEGHGIHVPTLQTLLEGVDLLLTCDTGVAAYDAIAYATSQGVETVITDHHALPDTLPHAVAVVNPMRLPDGHPMRELPGVGVAYQLVRALYGTKSSEHLLDLVAVGIVADVMVLVDDTRYWLQRGLAILRQAQRPSLRAILERAEVDPLTLNETTIGFSLAPRLNALGRLADANPAVELLTTSDPAVIAELVNELEGLNNQRRFLTEQVYNAAKAQLAENPDLLKFAALVVAGEHWHTGVVGIVASRLVEDYGRPVFVLAEHDGLLSGSGRSVAGCNLVEALRTQADMLTGFGGHTMAAGVRLTSDKLLHFRRGISHAVRTMLGSVVEAPTLPTDATLAFTEITLDFADEINQLAPFGNGNPPLRFLSTDVSVKKQRQLGRRADHLELTMADADGHEQKVKWWFGDSAAIPEGNFDVVYTLRPNVFKGKREVMMEWLEARQSVQQRPKSRTRHYAIVDYRHTPVDMSTLLATYPDALVWREGTKAVNCVDRNHLTPSPVFLIWSPPPSQAVWQTMLEIVQPQTLVLLGQMPPFDQAPLLLKQVGGLLNFALNQRQGRVEVNTLAALTCHTETTIHAALTWLNTHSELEVTTLTPDVYQILQRSARPSQRNPVLMDKLTTLLKETVAYRQFWLRQRFDIL